MYTPSVGEWAVGAVLLHVHAKETNIHTINLLKGKKCFGSVGKGLWHFTRVHESVVTGVNTYVLNKHETNAETFHFLLHQGIRAAI